MASHRNTATSPRSDPRERMIRSAAILFRERGIEGTAFSDVLEHSGAPRGSIYHHFPGGKAQLAEEATRYAGDFIAAGLATALAHEEPATALGRFVETWAAILRESGGASGCPVVAATLEGQRSPAAHRAAREAFRSWEELIAEALEMHGVMTDRARSLATVAIAAVEGAVILSRAERSTEPLERVGRELEQLLRGVLPRDAKRAAPA
jgi:AcrR family transcriptional regulator